MEAAFLKIVNMSITAGWAALAVMLARLLFKTAPNDFCFCHGNMTDTGGLFPF